MLADVVAGALVVDAAAAERFRHEPGAGDLLAPERFVEQDGHPQIVRRTIEIGDVFDHRAAQLFAIPAHGGEPGMRQAHQHQVEIPRLRPLPVHHVELVAAGAGLADLEHPVIELNVGVYFGAKAFDQLLVAVLDRIQADIAVDIHHEVLQRIQAVGVVGLGRDIRARHRLQKALGNGIIDLLVEYFLAGHVGPGMLVVVRADAHRYRLQAEMLDQFPQRIRAGHRIIVDFGDAGLVHCRRGIELPRQNLAPDAVGRLVDRDAAEIAELFLQIPGAHQPARPAAYDCKIQHVFSVALRPPCLGKQPV